MLVVQQKPRVVNKAISAGRQVATQYVTAQCPGVQAGTMHPSKAGSRVSSSHGTGRAYGVHEIGGGGRQEGGAQVVVGGAG
jgi:hypothetical protein